MRICIKTPNFRRIYLAKSHWWNRLVKINSMLTTALNTIHGKIDRLIIIVIVIISNHVIIWSAKDFIFKRPACRLWNFPTHHNEIFSGDFNFTRAYWWSWNRFYLTLTKIFDLNLVLVKQPVYNIFNCELKA